MAAVKHKKLLVAVDGSERALNTVRYVGGIDAFRKMQVVLFHVFSGVPEAYYDLEREPKSIGSLASVRSWEAQQKQAIADYMEKARQVLLKAGFAAAAVKVNIHKRKKGIARDIVVEAGRGYHAVILRRRGMTALRGIILGSVATKLLEKLSFVPLVLVGRKPPGKRILVPVDGSDGAMKAVAFLGDTLAGDGYEAKLVYVIRGDGLLINEEPGRYLAEEDAVTARSRIQSFLDGATRRLLDAGWPAEAITTEIVSGARSRAATIVDVAKAGGYATIVMGRRGLSRTRDFFIGRVSDKVIHLAREKTVWVIT
jgi:nucleotide-binding universal stress UspA family protein